MSGYYYSQQTTPSEEDEFDFTQPYQPRLSSNVQQQPIYHPYTGQVFSPTLPQGPTYGDPQQYYQQSQQYAQQPQYQQPQQQYPGYTQATQYQPQYNYTGAAPSPFITPTVPSNYPYHTQHQNVTPFPAYSEAAGQTPRLSSAGPSGTPAGYLSPDEASLRARTSRATSFASSTHSSTTTSAGPSGSRSYSHSDVSTRSVSPLASELHRWGYQNSDGSWRCRHPGCTSKSTFSRGCDLRKHYKRHTKSLFCRVEGCPQATEGGFSSKKDRARHEAKHNPGVVCEWEGCERLFSRVDNMVGLSLSCFSFYTRYSC